MIVTPKQIYTNLATTKEIPVEILSSIGETVLQELRNKLNDPRELSYEVPGLGTFNLRLRKFVTYYNNVKDKPEEQGTENLLRAQATIEKIEVYFNDRRNTRKERHEIIPDNNEEH